PVPLLDGEVDIKSAFVHTKASLAVKIASGFFKNPDIGLPSQSGQMLVISAKTGMLEAVLLDNGYLTQIRTAAAGAISAKYFAKKEIENVGVFGCGVQARYQMEAISLVRDFKKIYMFSIDTEERKKAFVDDMKKSLNKEVIVASSGEELVKNCDIVVTTTPSRKAYFSPDWTHPGLHITSMGSDAEDKQELYAKVFTKTDIIACDLISQSTRLGELRAPKEAGIIKDLSVVREIGDVIGNKKKGRENDRQVSVCDLTGVGVQDTMVATMAYEIAKEKNLGLRVER
ncbi:MAG: ornithine cyclodeaminase family protein, partial [Spirochaetia bacterium]|nr:ornithine cyclodeaminase family protein [Spirochaetia bacterium]